MQQQEGPEDQQAKDELGDEVARQRREGAKEAVAEPRALGVGGGQQVGEIAGGA